MLPKSEIEPILKVTEEVRLAIAASRGRAGVSADTPPPCPTALCQLSSLCAIWHALGKPTHDRPAAILRRPPAVCCCAVASNYSVRSRREVCPLGSVVARDGTPGRCIARSLVECCCAVSKSTGQRSDFKCDESRRTRRATDEQQFADSFGDVDRRRTVGKEAAGRTQLDLQESHFAVHAIQRLMRRGALQPPRFTSTTR